MANDTVLLPGGGGDTIRTEEIGLVKYPVSKLVLGADGVDDGDVSAANPMPITGTITVNVGLTDTELRASAVPVTGPLTDAQLRALAVPVSGTFFQATQPVSGPLTDVQLRATPVPVSGTVTATNAGTFAVQASQAGTWTVDLSVTDNAAIDLIATNLRQVDLNTDPGTDNWLGVGLVFASSLGGIPVSNNTPLPVSVQGLVFLDEPVTVDGAVTVSGSVSITGSVAVNASQSGTWVVTGAGGTFPVIGTFWQATQPVSLASVPSHDVTNAGTFAVQAAQSGTWTVQIGNTPNSTPILTSERPATSGGLTPYSFLSTAAVQATAVKASAGQIYSLSFFNKGAAAVYLRLYNMTTTPGTGDTVIWRAIIPGNTAGAGLVKHFPNGLAFSTGIGFRCTGAIADNDATVLAANEVTGNIEYN